MCEAGDEALPNRISSPRHHDRDRVRGVLGGTDRSSAHAHKHVHLELDQLGRPIAEPLGTALRSPELDDEILTLNVAEGPKALPESLQNLRGRAPTMEQTDPVYLCRLLRIGGERRREQAQGEHYDAPDSATPHGHLLTSTSYRPASF